MPFSFLNTTHYIQTINHLFCLCVLQVILAGDPYQLGPILSSKLAGEHGMQLSMLERIMSRKAYQRNESKFSDHGCYDPLLVRSHGTVY